MNKMVETQEKRKVSRGGMKKGNAEPNMHIEKKLRNR